MIKVQIGSSEIALSDISESWINNQINRRRSDGVPICVKVFITESDLDIILATPSCGNTVGGGRSPRPREQEIFDLWNRHRLNVIDFTGGNLVGFLKQLNKFI